jgi:Reverse transcriptase (RNA-dependent DNA polymerase)
MNLKKKAATGIDEQTWKQYQEKGNLWESLIDLHGRVHRGAYRAQPSKRIYLEKPDGRKRPIGIAALEDKIVQGAVVEILSAIYEEDFLGFSYGFRPGHGQHDALDALSVALQFEKVGWVLDADIQSFFRYDEPRMDDEVPPASSGRSTYSTVDPEMANSRSQRGRRVESDNDRDATGRSPIASAGEHLPALRARSLGAAMAKEIGGRDVYRPLCR